MQVQIPPELQGKFPVDPATGQAVIKLSQLHAWGYDIGAVQGKEDHYAIFRKNAPAKATHRAKVKQRRKQKHRS